MLIILKDQILQEVLTLQLMVNYQMENFQTLIRTMITLLIKDRVQVPIKAFKAAIQLQTNHSKPQAALNHDTWREAIHMKMIEKLILQKLNRDFPTTTKSSRVEERCSALTALRLQCSLFLLINMEETGTWITCTSTIEEAMMESHSILDPTLI